MAITAALLAPDKTAAGALVSVNPSVVEVPADGATNPNPLSAQFVVSNVGFFRM